MGQEHPIGRQFDDIAEEPIIVAVKYLMSELSGAGNYGDIIAVLLAFTAKNPEASSNVKAGMFLFRNYYIKPAQLGKSTSFLDNLKYLQANAYCHTAAPDFIGMPVSTDKKSCAVITRINNSEGGDLLPYHYHAASEEKRRMFADELIVLLNETSLYNPFIVDKSYKGWYVTPKEKNIIFDDWSTLVSCGSEKEKAEIREKIVKSCALAGK